MARSHRTLETLHVVGLLARKQEHAVARALKLHMELAHGEHLHCGREARTLGQSSLKAYHSYERERASAH